MKSSILSILATLASLSLAQLSGSVGPLTSIATKTAKKTCNVLSYGAVADKSTDLGPPLLAAFNACKSGGVVVIPSGNYALATWVTLSGGSAWALQLDGIIYRTGTAGGNMIFVEHTSDFELFSSTGSGAVQGNGYTFHQSGSLSGPRILRFYSVSNFAIHDVKLVDSPAFHFSMDTCSNGEVYNMIIRGADHGGLDGIDVWSTNIWIHDIMVTNKDECVTVKSPSTNLLIENIYCNDSGGCAFGSLGTGTAISNIVYRNVYTVLANQMLMIKSNGGSGYVENVVLENFIGHKNAYSLDIDQYWSSMSTIAGSGVALSNITAKNWKGTESNGAQRGPIKVMCADGAPCKDITIEDFAMWTESGSTEWYSCRSAYGSGPCLKADTSNPTSYAASTTTVKSAPSGYSAATMPYDLATGFGFTVSIPIPTVWPASYYPGAAKISPYASGSAAVLHAVVSSSTSTSTSTKAASTSASILKTSSSASPVGSTTALTSSAGVKALSSAGSSAAAAPSSKSVKAFSYSGSTTTAASSSSVISTTMAKTATNTTVLATSATSSSGNYSSLSTPMATIPTTAIAVPSLSLSSAIIPPKNNGSTSLPASFTNSSSPTGGPVPTYPAWNSTSPVSFTSTWTGNLGKPTKFTCYAEE